MTTPPEPDADPGTDFHWADEARLDEAFSGWVPGPPPGAPAAEREMAEHGEDGEPQPQAPPEEVAGRREEVAPPEEVAGLAEVAGEAVPAGTEAEEPGTAPPPPVAEEARPWTRSDDDVLPARRRSGRKKGR